MRHTTRLKLIKIVFTIAVIILLFVPASVSHPQIDMRALVTSIGLDLNENQIELSAEVVLPKEGGGASGISEVITKKAKTLPKAIDDISIALGRKLELNHCGIIVLGQDYAAHNPTPDFEYLLSSGKVCPEINLVVAQNDSARDFIDKLSSYSQKLDLSNLLRYVDLGVQNYSCSLVKFLTYTRSKSGCAALPCLKMDTQGEKNGDEKPQGIIESAKKTAIFKNENEKAALKKILDENETFGMAWLDRRTKKGYLFVHEIEFENQTLNDIPLLITHKSLKTSAQIKNDQPIFSLNIKVRLDIEDRHELNALRKEGQGVPKPLRDALERKAEEIISSSILSAYNKAKDQEIDLMLIADGFFRQQNKFYKANPDFDYLSNTEFKVNCKISLN